MVWHKLWLNCCELVLVGDTCFQWFIGKDAYEYNENIYTELNYQFLASGMRQNADN